MFQDDDESFLSQERLRYDIFRTLGVKYLVNTKENILIIYLNDIFLYIFTALKKKARLILMKQFKFFIKNIRTR